MAIPGAIRTLDPVVRTAPTQNFYLSERKYPSNRESTLHSHVKNYIIVTLEGKYLSTFDHGAEQFTPWTITFHEAGMLHNSHYGDGGARVLYIEIPTERLKDFRKISASHLKHFSLRGGAIEWTARQLHNEFIASDGFSPFVMDGLVIQMLAHLLRWRMAQPQRMPAWLGKADEIVRNFFMQPLTLAGIAKAVRVHPGHLAREYMRFYNYTIGEQIRRLRIEYACDQLASTDRGLADIALNAGFSDQSHFTVSFKQYIGTAPSHYRKAVKAMSLNQKNVIPLQDTPYAAGLSLRQRA